MITRTLIVIAVLLFALASMVLPTMYAKRADSASFSVNSASASIPARAMAMPDATAEVVAKVGVPGAAPVSGNGPQRINWTIDYGLTSTSPQSIILNDTWTAGQTLVPGSLRMPGGSWTSNQPNATSLNFTNFSSTLIAPNGQGVTIAAPRPLGAVSFSGGGDGYNVAITASGKFFAANHHSIPSRMVCYNAITNATCTGYPKFMNAAAGFSGDIGVGYNSKVIAIGNRIYISDDSAQACCGQTGHIYCWDTDTNAQCGQSPVISHSGMELVNGKLFVVSSAGALDCYDPANNLNRCAGFSPVSVAMPPSPSVWQGNVDLFGVGSKVFVTNYQRRLTCFDSATNAICAGWPALPAVVSTTASGNPRSNIFPRLNNAGSITGICVAGLQTDATCYNLDSSNPTSVSMGGSVVSDPYRTANVDAYVGTRIFFPAFADTPPYGLGCFNWATQAACTGPGYSPPGRTTADGGYPYGVTTDGANIFSYGDAGVLYSWNPNSGQRPSNLGATSVTVNIDDFYCGATSPVAATWDKIIVTDANLVAGVEFTSIKASLVDPSTGNIVFGPTEMINGAGVLDVSSVPSTYRTLRLQLDETPVGTVAWNDNIPPKATLTFVSSAPVQFCYQTSTTCAGVSQTHSDTINTNLDPHSATASCDVCVPSPNLVVTKSSPSPSLVPYQNSSYTITVTNNGNAPTSSATVKDALPIGLDLVSAGGPNWSCVPATGSSPVGIVTCSLVGMIAANGGTSVFNVDVKPLAAYGDSTVINYVSVDPSGGTQPPNPGSCTAAGSPNAGCGNPVTSNIAPTPPNSAPVAQSQSVTTNEDTAQSITLVATDIDNNPLTYTIVSGPTHGSLSGAAPNLTYSPAANYNGSDSFTFKANDGTLDSNTATVSITVTPLNDAPIAGNDSYSTNEDTTLNVASPGVLGNDTDLDGNTLSANLDTAPLHGTLTLNPNGSFSYAPAANYHGLDSFKYRANDGTVDSNLATVSITVNPVNDAPTLSAGGPYSVDEGASVPISATGTDIDDDPLTFAWDLDNDGQFDDATGANASFSAAGIDGPATRTINVRVSDSGGLTAVRATNVTINNVNPSAAINGAPPTSPEGIQINLTATVTDAGAADTHALSWSVTKDAPALISQNSNGVAFGPSKILQTFSINGGNDANAPNQGNVVVASGSGPSFSFTPDDNGSYVVTLTATDDDGGVGATSKTVEVTNVNPSVNAGANKAVDEGAPFTGAAAYSDPGSADTHAATIDYGDGTITALFAVSGGTVPLSHTYNDNGAYTVTVTVQDDDGGSQSDTLLVAVNNVAPTANLDSYSVNEDATLIITAAGGVLANDTDPGGVSDPLTAAVLAGPSNGTLTLNPDGSLSYSPNQDFNGADSFTYQVSDGDGGSATGTVSITVNAVNDAPSFTTGGNQSVNEDAGARTVPNWATNISAGPAQESGQTIDFVLTNNNNSLFSAQPAVAANGTLTYTPAPDANGVATVFVQIHDNGGTANGGHDTSAGQTFILTVNEVNDAPSFTKGADQGVTEDSGTATVANWATNISPGAANESGQALTFAIQNNTNPGLFSAGPAISSNGTLSYTPAANANGSAMITIALIDNGGGMDTSASQTFAITVSEVNDAPTPVNDTLASVAEDSGQRTIGFATLTANDSKGPADESGQTLIVKTVSNPVGGTVSIFGGDVIFTVTANYNGPASFDYTVEDNGMTLGVAAPLTSETASASFSITEVNDAPDAVNDALSSVAEDSATRTIPIASLVSNDTKGAVNESNQTLSFSLVAASEVGGTVTNDATNVYFTPLANFNGPASFQYSVTDNGTSNGSPDPKSDTATISFHITEANDVPDAVNDSLASVLEDSSVRTIPIASMLTNDSAGPSDESGQTLSFSLVAGSGVGGTVTSDATNVYFTPSANFNGPASFQYMVTDNGTTHGVPDPKSDTGTLSFNITEVNDAPTAAGETLGNVAEDSGPRTIPFANLTANDSSGPANESSQSLIIKTVSNPAGGTVSILGGNVLFTPTLDYKAAASFDYTVEDNGTTNGSTAPLTSGTATASFTITEVNDAPTALNDPLGNLAEDSGERTIQFASLTSNDSRGPANESGQTLIVKTVSNPVGGTVNIVAGTVRFMPAANYNGPGNFRYTVEDNGTTNGVADPKTSATAIASFNITEVNDAPIAVNDTLSNVAEDSGQQTIPFADLTGNDSKGPANESNQTLIVKSVSNPVGGTVSLSGGNVMFTPTADYNGSASFDYTVEDNGATDGAADPLTSAAATATFSNIAVADTPSVTNATTNANTQTTSGLVISRNPADGSEVTHFRITGITGGSLFKHDGTTPINNGDFITFAEGNAGLRFTPGTANGSFTVQASLSASEAGLGGGTATATITVSEVGGVITFSAANYSVAEGAGWRVITVERTGDTSQAVTVDYASSDHSNPADFIPCTSPGAGLASSRCDFTTAIGTLRFAAGETSKSFNVVINQDNYLEGPETLDLTLSNPTSGTVLGTPAAATLEITDDASESATNPIDTPSEFVRALYHDMLNREPDGPGLAFWTDNIEKCNDPARLPAGQTVAECTDKQRESTAIAFFMSPEFQMTGGFVYRLYKGSLTGSPNYDGAAAGSPGRFPTSLEFMRDVSLVSQGILVNNQISGAVVEANRNRLAEEFVERPEFVAKYGGLDNTLYVQELFNTTGISQEQLDTTGSNSMAEAQQALVDGLTNGTETRASVLRKVVDGTVVISESNVQFTTPYGHAFYDQEQRRVFVFMEYVGYLRRNPDAAGFIFWLGKLNQFNGDPFQAEMVRSFILSPEYRSRFGQP